MHVSASSEIMLMLMMKMMKFVCYDLYFYSPSTALYSDM